jgi:hypothetical protein
MVWTEEFPLMGEDVPVLSKKDHTYSDLKGNNYKSVSSILSKIKPKFDLERKAFEYASKKDMLVEDVLKLWEEKKNAGLNFGTNIHENIEKYFKNKNKEEVDSKYLEQIVQVFDEVYDKRGYNELICFDKCKLICGTADYVVFKDGTFDIFDFKTNIKFNFENSFDQKYLLDPVSHLPNSEYFTYALQLSFYASMISNLTSLKCDFLNIYWLKRQLDIKGKFKAKWLRYTVPYLKKEVEDILCIV